MSQHDLSKIEIVYREARAKLNVDILTSVQAMEFLQIASKRTFFRILADPNNGLNAVKIGGRLRFPLMSLIEYSLSGNKQEEKEKNDC